MEYRLFEMVVIENISEMYADTAAAKGRSAARNAERYKKRFSARFDARLRIALDSLDAVTDVVIMDISSGGVSAAVASDLCVGSLVCLEIPLVGWRDAEVRWLTDGRAGCRFLVPLSETELLTAVVDSPLIRENFPGFVDQLGGRDTVRGSVRASPASDRVRKSVESEAGGLNEKGGKGFDDVRRDKGLLEEPASADALRFPFEPTVAGHGGDDHRRI